MSTSTRLQPLTLLTLPAELRNKIWKEVFTIEPPAHDPAWNQDRQAGRIAISYNPKKAHTKSVLAALLVCRQLHREAWPLFYTENLLSFLSPQALFTFLNKIRTPQREHVRAIHVANLGVHWTSLNAEKAFSTLFLCHNLQEVYVDFDKALIGSAAFFLFDEPDDPLIIRLKVSENPVFSSDVYLLDEWCQQLGTADALRLQHAIQTLGNLRGLRDFQIRMDWPDNPKRTKAYVASVRGQAVDRFWSSEKELDWPLVDIHFLSEETVELNRAVKQPRALAKTRYERATEDILHEPKRKVEEDDDEPPRKKVMMAPKRNIDSTDDEEEFDASAGCVIGCLSALGINVRLHR